MKITVVALLTLSMAVSAGIVEFGAHAGILLPNSEINDAFNISPILGINVLAHMPVYAIEGSVSYGILQPKGEVSDATCSLIPILAGLRTYSGPVFYGFGAGMYITSFSHETVDDSETDFGAYGNCGIILPAGSMDLEGSFKYHLVDFDMDKAWFALTVGTYF